MTASDDPVRAVAWSLAGAVPDDLTPAEAARRLAHRARLTAWAGEWSAGALLTCDPVRLAADPVAALADLPRVVDSDPGACSDPAGVAGSGPSAGLPAARVGGGWFGTLPFTGPGVMAFHPDLLRYDGTWHYEALIGPDLTAARASDRRAALVADLNRPSAAEPAWLQVHEMPDLAAHCVAVEECVRAIRRGEVYQANIAGRVDLHLHGSPVEAWARLVEAHAPARAALVVGPEGAAVGASPELFLHRSGRTVRTAPIKGTRPRRAGDATERDRLAASAKDAAENVMIVDLMRNDLSRVAAPGTVTVPRLLEVEPHAGVWHLVSEVTATLAPGRDDADLVRATFPPGSVTGTPKIRAVALIEQLEAAPRGLFTGAVGYASPLAGLELAVAIRTLEVAPDGTTQLWVGGGVTVDSTPAEEYRECLTKAAPILQTLTPRPEQDTPREGEDTPPAGPQRPRVGQQSPRVGQSGAPVGQDRPGVGRSGAGVRLFETLLVVDGRAHRLADHVGRVRRSWFELTGIPLHADLASAVLKAAAPLVGAHRLRLDVDGGPPRTTTAPLGPPPPPAVLRIRRSESTYPHKSADRAELEAHEAAVGPGETPLLVDPVGLVLETTRHSVFALVDGVWRTPPLDGRILPGTARTAFLDDHPAAHPAVVTLDDLVRAEAVLLTNALRRVEVVELRDAEGGRLATWPARPATTP
ncbi:chorismate-binding protein [Pseudonocardia xishanensis]|uniref:Chorismate-utilising enzyme C-terminal domain-containing protein n=1 Tax=Pseudonocardia xishanensis TaxID=630995 RepID=A0ABP8RJX7_9PSEU